VKDAVAMTLHLAANPGANGLFNLGSGQARSWLELGHALFTALGREPQIDFVEMPDTLRDKYQYFTQADISHLRSTGYTDPVTPLEDAVADYVQNYLVPGRYLETETV
jgi:ADP-L-glycero-D-manno-heptose 6-epimerase